MKKGKTLTHVATMLAFAKLIIEYPFHKQQEMRLMLGTYLNLETKKVELPHFKLEKMFEKADPSQQLVIKRAFKTFKPSK